MRSFFPIIFGTVFILFFGLVEILLMRLLNREWWRKKFIRRATWGLPLAGIAAVILWGIGEYHSLSWLAVPGALLAVLTFVLEVALMLSLPISGALHFVNWVADRITKRRTGDREPGPIDSRRRVFLKGVAAAVPIVTLSTGVAGVTRAFGPVNVFRLPVPFEGLPAGLEGLRVFQLSDLHLRSYVTIDDLEPVIEKARSFNPDITLVTGDIADDLNQLPEALKMIDSLKPRLGTYAIPGNHEYFRGIDEVKRIFSRSPIPLFINEATRIRVGDTDLFLGGIDDPRHMGVDNSAFFRGAIEQTMRDSRSTDFPLLMSHRPEAFDIAADRGIRLVLAGHTHGGQIGLFRKSLFEELLPNKYLWGLYRNGSAHLYTTSGMGHWFPFRLGCPQEAPILELTRA